MRTTAIPTSRTFARPTIAAATLLCAFAGSAGAADLYGGGSSFAVPFVAGDLYLQTSPRARLSRDPAVVSPAVPFSAAQLGRWSSPSYVPAFRRFRALYPGDAVSYCQSDVERKVYNRDSYAANGVCGDWSAIYFPTGFSALDPMADFIATEMPVRTRDYWLFDVNLAPTHTAMMQIPAFAGAIALTYRPHPSMGSVPLSLNTERLCRLFSAQITDWSDPALGLSLPSPAPITMIRPEGSNSLTYAFSAYLARTCNGQYGVPAGHFVVSAYFDSAFHAAQPGARPAFAAIASVRNGDADAVALTMGTGTGALELGYASLGAVQAQSAAYASLNGFLPENLPQAFNLPANLLLKAKVIDDAGGAAVPMPGANAQAVKNCTLLVDPQWTPPAGTYPLVAVSYFNAYYRGNAAQKLVPLKNLFKLFYDPANAPPPPPGYAYLYGNPGFRAQTVYNINNCLG
ncbi:substrate-binding domain-containing protein [Lysobacter sp. CA199]|uniref:substrate-binding domain-containing protein n=1 Tax=Lysobacter sp. CA199 TaxID=3455608 RepID=UPI003F8D6067